MGGVDSNTLREQLNAALDVYELRQLEAEMNAALAAAIPVGMPRSGLEVAIDTPDEPFYAKTSELLTYTCSGQAKAGRTHFFRICQRLCHLARGAFNARLEVCAARR